MAAVEFMNAAGSGVTPVSAATPLPVAVISGGSGGGGAGSPTLSSPQINLTNVPKLVSGAACTLVDYVIYNTGLVVAYVHIFNAATAGAVILGTTVPVRSIGVPPGQTVQIAGLTLALSAGLVVAATGGAGADATALANPVNAAFGYR